MVKHSPIWTYFIEKSDEKRAQCILCTNKIVEFATPHSATSQLWEHMKKAHHNEWE
jgi:hypothetical protein